jgi:hypothetical protein
LFIFRKWCAGEGNVFLAVDVGETNPMLQEGKPAFEVFL